MAIIVDRLHHSMCNVSRSHCDGIPEANSDCTQENQASRWRRFDAALYDIATKNLSDDICWLSSAPRSAVLQRCICSGLPKNNDWL